MPASVTRVPRRSSERRVGNWAAARGSVASFDWVKEPLDALAQAERLLTAGQRYRVATREESGSSLTLRARRERRAFFIQRSVKGRYGWN
jgi:hypothetical protein